MGFSPQIIHLFIGFSSFPWNKPSILGCFPLFLEASIKNGGFLGWFECSKWVCCLGCKNGVQNWTLIPFEWCLNGITGPKGRVLSEPSKTSIILRCLFFWHISCLSWKQQFRTLPYWWLLALRSVPHNKFLKNANGLDTLSRFFGQVFPGDWFTHFFLGMMIQFHYVFKWVVQPTNKRLFCWTPVVCLKIFFVSDIPLGHTHLTICVSIGYYESRSSMCVVFTLFFHYGKNQRCKRWWLFVWGHGFWTKRCWKTRCRTAKSSCVDQLSPTDFFRGLEDPKETNGKNWDCHGAVVFLCVF